MSSVRLAFVASVAWTPPAGPPVRFHRSHASIVPNRSSPRAARARAPSTLSRIQRSFGPEKYVASGRPVRARYRAAPPPSAPSASQIPCVRVSCQTIAGWIGRPVARSHTTVVSRWFAIPTAASADAPRPAFASAPAATRRALSRISSASCSTQPGLGKRCACSSRSLDTTRPARSKIMHRVLVVP